MGLSVLRAVIVWLVEVRAAIVWNAMIWNSVVGNEVIGNVA